jgi:Zn-dependent M32 family carboxypeptidase
VLRFDLELKLLEGRLRIKDLPEAWRASMQADLGLAPPDTLSLALTRVQEKGPNVEV